MSKGGKSTSNTHKRSKHFTFSKTLMSFNVQHTRPSTSSSVFPGLWSITASNPSHPYANRQTSSLYQTSKIGHEWMPSASEGLQRRICLGKCNRDEGRSSFSPGFVFMKVRGGVALAASDLCQNPEPDGHTKVPHIKTTSLHYTRFPHRVFSHSRPDGSH